MKECAQKKTDYLVLVNAEHRLPDDFEDTIELIDFENAAGKACKIEKKTYEAFLRLREDLFNNDGIQAEISSVYRTIRQQEAIFEDYTARFGPDYAKQYVAKPGHSEHHTGIAIDVGMVIEGKFHHGIKELFRIEPLYKAVHAKAPRYGFLLRYPKGKEASTGIGYEPWHFRYIDSPQLAMELTDKGMSLEEYWEKMRGSGNAD